MKLDPLFSPGPHGEHDERMAFAGIVAHYQGPLFGYLGRMGLGQAQAEDIAQEAFLRAWTHRAGFDPARARYSTWLFTIAHRLALNELDRAARRHEVWEGDTPLDALPGPAASQPLEALDAAQARQRLQAALRQLPVADRSALALAYFRELDLNAIAQIEACSLAALKVRLHRAKARLRALLETPHED